MFKIDAKILCMASKLLCIVCQVSHVTVIVKHCKNNVQLGDAKFYVTRDLLRID